MASTFSVRLHLVSNAVVVVDIIGVVNRLAAIQHVNGLMQAGKVGIFSSKTSEDGWVSINMVHVTHAETL